MRVNIIHEDDDVIVCIKPNGMPSQSDKSVDEDLVSYLKNHIYEEKKMTTEPYLGVIHRLDRPVAGVMVFAKNKEAASKLSEQVVDGRMIKYYQAVLTGELPGWNGTLVDYLLQDPITNVSRVVPEGTEGAKKAELNYEVLDVYETDEGILSYVLIELVTGRHHQIRVQTASRKAGIWGDTKYNPKFKKVKKKYKQIGLFSSRLEFEHPTTGEHLVFKREPEGAAFDILEMEEF